MSAAPPAAKDLVAQLDLTGTEDRLIAADAVLQEKDAHEQLPDRARRIDALDDAVLQREAVAGPQGVPVAFGDARGKKIVVVGRRSDQRPQLARVRLHDHHAARLPGQGVPGGLLQIAVEGEADLLAAAGLLAQGLAQHAAVRVHLHAIQALAAAQPLLQLVFQTLLAHQIAHGQIRVLFHLLLVGFGHIAEHMGEEILFRIAALAVHRDLQPRPVDELGLDAGHQLEIHVRDHEQRLEGFHLEAVHLIFFPDLLQGDACPLADLGQGRGDIVAVLADERQPAGRAVVGQHLAAVVQDAAAWGEDAFFTQTVGLGLARELLAPVHLQIPEAGNEDEKKDGHQSLQQQSPGTGRLVPFIVHLLRPEPAGTPGLFRLLQRGTAGGIGGMVILHAAIPSGADRPAATRPRAHRAPE